MTEFVAQITDLHRSFEGKPALQGVTLDIPRGAVLGLVGENGAGKTTLLNHLLGLLRPNSGRVSVFGLNPVQEPAEVLGRIGYLSESRDLPAWMRIDQYMNYQRGFYPNWNQTHADELVNMFELDRTQRLKTLSRGQLARVGLLGAIAHRPELLLLDEPSSGLDPVVRRDILAAIIRTVADDGRTVLFSSHLLDEVQRVSDHVAMLHQGQLLLSDKLESVLLNHTRITVQLAEPVSTAPCVPGAIDCQGSDREWSILSNGRRSDVDDWLRETQAKVVDSGAPSLDEIFVAHVRRVGGPESGSGV